MVLIGRVINEGKAEGEAVVSQLPFSFLGDFEVSTGKIMTKGHDCEGQSIKGKIFIFPTGKGSTAGPNVAFIGKQLGTIPAGMILIEAEPVIAMVGIMNDIPMVHRLDKNPLQEIRTGDYVTLDAYTGKVLVTRR